MPFLMQSNGLKDRINAFTPSESAINAENLANNLFLLTLWLHYIETNFKTGIANELLSAAGSCLRESAAYISIGLIKPIIFNYRTVIDLCLAWYYFKDHAIEWSYVNTTGDGYKMKKEILEYISRTCPRFPSCYGILKDVKKRRVVDIYRLLSAHIHAQSLVVLPNVNNFVEVVGDNNKIKDIIDLAFETSEYMSDLFTSIYIVEWMTLPEEIKSSIMCRFKSDAQRIDFFREN